MSAHPISKLKYIRTLMHGIIVFPESICHNRFESFDPISAGFIEFFDNNTVKCFGESVTLKLKSRPDDSRLATKQLLNKS